MKKIVSILFFLSCMANAGLGESFGLVGDHSLQQAKQEKAYIPSEQVERPALSKEEQTLAQPTGSGMGLARETQLQTAASQPMSRKATVVQAPVVQKTITPQRVVVPPKKPVQPKIATVAVKPVTAKKPVVTSQKTPTSKVLASVKQATNKPVVRAVSYRENSTWLWPVAGGIVSEFGWRSLRVAGSNFHNGIDIDARTGTPVRAARAGTVIRSGWDRYGFGYVVMIDHGNGYKTLYGHNSRLLVSSGDYVRAGQIISRVGSTGFSTGSHLHFGVYLNDKAINPRRIR